MNALQLVRESTSSVGSYLGTTKRQIQGSDHSNNGKFNKKAGGFQRKEQNISVVPTGHLTFVGKQ